jgi:hypothetical protein
MKRKATPRYNALVFGFFAEVNMGIALVLWLEIPDYAGRALFGAVVSKVVLIAAMAALAVSMLALVFAARLGMAVLRTCVMVASLAVAGVGALALGGLFSEPSPVLPLALAGFLSVWVVVAILRASVRRAGPGISEGERA